MFSASQDRLREHEKEISAGQDRLQRHKCLAGKIVKGHKLLLRLTCGLPEGTKKRNSGYKGCSEGIQGNNKTC